jgi:hypothetical protein
MQLIKINVLKILTFFRIMLKLKGIISFLIKGWGTCMSNHSCIKLVSSSTKQDIDMNEIKAMFHSYVKQNKKTAQQLNWNYEYFSFPYEIEDASINKEKIKLISNHDRYHSLSIHIERDKDKQTVIIVSLLNQSTYADKGKANDLCKFLAKNLEAELHLFNGRVMYYNRRK